MSTVSEKPGPHWSEAKLRRHFGNIPLERILDAPRAGTATEADLIKTNERHRRLAELVDGCLVEKAMGAAESVIAGWIIQLINNYLDKNPLGYALGECGMVRLMPGLVRIPDVCFVSFVRRGTDEMLEDPVLKEVPELAIEVINPSNTKKEMQRKLDEYFTHGVQEVWIVYPQKKRVDVYKSVDAMETRTDFLEGGTILPGFKLNLDDLFQRRNRKK